MIQYQVLYFIPPLEEGPFELGLCPVMVGPGITMPLPAAGSERCVYYEIYPTKILKNYSVA